MAKSSAFQKLFIGSIWALIVVVFCAHLYLDQKIDDLLEAVTEFRVKMHENFTNLKMALQSENDFED